jgi:hypothetical protein
MYSTNAGALGGQRVRLLVNKSPVSDFGIMRGSKSVPARDKLAFYFREDGTYLAGQDPNEHYWIYFTFLSGEVGLLDMDSMALNSCSVVDARPYWKPFNDVTSLLPVPAIFYGSEESKMFPLLDGLSNIQLKSDRRFSILRDNRLSGEVLSLDHVFYSILDEIAGHASTPEEKYLMMKFFLDACCFLRSNMRNRDYLNFPKEPKVMYDSILAKRR